MKIQKCLSQLTAGIVLIGTIGMPQPHNAAASDGAPAKEETINGSIHSIQLPDDPFELPPGPGRDTTQAFCVACHTTRYIVNQPPFSREVWTAEVTKMRKTYSAPVPEDKVPEIITYLVSVRGLKPAH